MKSLTQLIAERRIAQAADLVDYSEYNRRKSSTRVITDRAL
jgi:hypothetical protein